MIHANAYKKRMPGKSEPCPRSGTKKLRVKDSEEVSKRMKSRGRYCENKIVMVFIVENEYFLKIAANNFRLIYLKGLIHVKLNNNMLLFFVQAHF